MYRRTRKANSLRGQMMAAARARSIASGPSPDYPAPLPDLRMRITVERFDLAEPERHVFDLHTTRRVDVYRVEVDGKPWDRCGLSRVLEGLRKACPRVISSRNL
jgi:hypothetical protein